MSAPGSLAIAKIMYPELERSKFEQSNAKTKVKDRKHNLFYAILEGLFLKSIDTVKPAKIIAYRNDIEMNQGSKEAVFLVCSIILTLLTFILMIEIINSILNEIGESIGKWLGTEINWMTLESLTFVIFVPCAWLMGIPYEEVTIAANVLAKASF